MDKSKSNITLSSIANSDAELLENPKEKFNWKKMVDAMNFSILTNPLFIIVGIANSIACLGLFVPYFYLPDLVVEKNFTKEESSYLISAMGKSKSI